MLLPWLRRWADLLDSRFRIPGTNIRFGIDPILSLVPGLGDLATPVFTVLLLAQAVQQRVPAAVLVRMVANALIDAALGAVPIIGNVGDVFWRANVANLALLERHAQPGRKPTRTDYVVLWIVVAVFGLLAGLLAIGTIWLLWALRDWNWRWL